MTKLHMEISLNFEALLLNLDERLMSKFIREYTKQQKIKNKKRKRKHETLRKGLYRQFK